MTKQLKEEHTVSASEGSKQAVVELLGAFHKTANELLEFQPQDHE